jgi:hypothetical protein
MFYEKWRKIIMTVLLEIHSYVRWLIVVVAVIAIVKFAWGWLRGGSFQKVDNILTAAFSGLMDLQATLGLIYFLWTGFASVGFPTFRIEHAVTMILAAAAGHLPMRWKKSAGKTRFRNTLLAILFALLLVYLGVARLPGGWAR